MKPNDSKQQSKNNHHHHNHGKNILLELLNDFDSDSENDEDFQMPDEEKSEDAVLMSEDETEINQTDYEQQQQQQQQYQLDVEQQQAAASYMGHPNSYMFIDAATAAAAQQSAMINTFQPAYYQNVLVPGPDGYSMATVVIPTQTTFPFAMTTTDTASASSSMNTTSAVAAVSSGTSSSSSAMTPLEAKGAVSSSRDSTTTITTPSKRVHFAQTTLNDEQEDDEFVFDRPITSQELSDLYIDSFFTALEEDEQEDFDYAPNTDVLQSNDAEEYRLDPIPLKEVAFLLRDSGGDVNDTEGSSVRSPLTPKRAKKRVDRSPSPPPRPHYVPETLFDVADLKRLKEQIATHHQLLLQTYSLSYLDQMCDSQTSASAGGKPKPLYDHTASASMNKTQASTVSTSLSNATKSDNGNNKNNTAYFSSFLHSGVIPMVNTGKTNDVLPNVNNMMFQQSNTSRNDNKNQNNRFKQKKGKKKKKHQREENGESSKLVDSRLVHEKVKSMIHSLHNQANTNHRVKTGYEKSVWTYRHRYDRAPTSPSPSPTSVQTILLLAIPAYLQTVANYFIRAIETSDIEYLKEKLGELYNEYNVLWPYRESLPNFAEGYPYKEKSKLGRLNFTKPEDKLLVLGLERFGVGSWRNIRDSLLPTKTIAQLQHRYKNMSAGKAPMEDNPIKEFYINRKKPLTDEEWNKIDLGIQKYGSKSQKAWEDLTKEFFPYTRDATFVRDQWLQKYEPDKYRQEQEKRKDAAKKRKRSDSDIEGRITPVQPQPGSSYHQVSESAINGSSSHHHPLSQPMPTEEEQIPNDILMMSLPSLPSLPGLPNGDSLLALTSNSAHKMMPAQSTDSKQEEQQQSPQQQPQQQQQEIVWEVEELSDQDDDDDASMGHEMTDNRNSNTGHHYQDNIPDNVMVINGQKVTWTLEDDRKILTASLKHQGGKEKIWHELVEQRVIANKDVNMITKRYEWLIKRLQCNL